MVFHHLFNLEVIFDVFGKQNILSVMVENCSSRLAIVFHPHRISPRIIALN